MIVKDKITYFINNFMFGLITMLLTTLGATGMGSLLKMLGGIFVGIHEVKQASKLKTHYSDKPMKKPQCLLVQLGALLLLSGCSTFSSSRSSAQSGQVLRSSHLPHHQTKKISRFYGDSSSSQVEMESRPQSRLDTSLLSQSPLWGR